MIGTKDEAGREWLLRKRPVPDLTVCVEDLRAAEASRSHKQAIMGAGTTASVDYMSRKGRKGKSQTQGHQSNSKQKYSHSQSRPQKQPQNSQRQPQNSQRQGKNSTNQKRMKTCRWCGSPTLHQKRLPRQRHTMHEV